MRFFEECRNSEFQKRKNEEGREGRQTSSGVVISQRKCMID
jgi:hypothetical protein